MGLTGGLAASTSDRHKRLSEMEFDIGTESPLERTWTREGRSQTPPPAGSTGSRLVDVTGDGDTTGSSSRRAATHYRSGGQPCKGTDDWWTCCWEMANWDGSWLLPLAVIATSSCTIPIGVVVQQKPMARFE